jgi:hypothetical protein
LTCCLLILHSGRARASPEVKAHRSIRIEAVRAAANAYEQPTSGRAAVSLPDDWSTRWPAYSRVVWYRLMWDEALNAEPRGLLLEYLNMAGAVNLNDMLLWREADIQEPLSRAWNTPHRWFISAPLLHRVSNTLLIRVSGIAAWRPSLGSVVLDFTDRVSALYERSY